MGAVGCRNGGDHLRKRGSVVTSHPGEVWVLVSACPGCGDNAYWEVFDHVLRDHDRAPIRIESYTNPYAGEPMSTTDTLVLDCPMGPNDANAETVRDYLKALLLKVWVQGEGFSGKRPFGNSGWEYDVTDALVEAGIAESESEAIEQVRDAIKAL